MKRFIILFVSAFLLLFLLCSCTFVSPAKETETESETEESTYIPKIKVSFFSENERFGTVMGNTEQSLAEGEKSKWVLAVPCEGCDFVGWSDGVTDKKREKESFSSDTEIFALFTIAQMELPILNFSMEGGNEVTSKTEYANVTLSVLGAEKEYCAENLGGRLRGRGNATWGMEKKSYRLKMDEKINLLGVGTGEAKDWILLANHCDQSLLRNYISFYLGRELSGIEYTSGGRFVELSINGDYKGVYLLCEQVEVKKSRVNIEVSPEKEDTGYLIELDQYAATDEGAEENVTYFYAGDYPYSVKSDATVDQVTFIKKYVKKAFSAVQRGNRAEIEALIDIDSFIDMYLIQEFMLNIDAGWSSFFMYKKPDGGKLYCGPVWDLDLAAGNDYRLFNGSHEGIYVADGANLYMVQENRWFIALMKTDWFKRAVLARWNETKDIFKSASSVAKETATSMAGAADRNFNKWKIFGDRINHEPEHILKLKSYTEHADYLCQWLDNRYTWLDNYFSAQ